MRRFIWGFFTILPLFACGIASSVEDPPSEPDTPDIPDVPSDPPPTGQVYDPAVGVDGCGHKTLFYRLVDEVCGARDAKHYTDRFRAPMFRDGAVIGSRMFTVDGTHLWTLDVSDPSKPPLLSLESGVGTPVSVAVHNADLVIAAGDEGLLVMDVSDPTAPKRKSSLPLGGPALHVSVTGDQALVAAGEGGLTIVDLAADPPTVLKNIDVPGFAASAKAVGDLAYVAACDTFAVVDLKTGETLGSAWLLPEQAVINGVLVAPAKDVEVRGTVAFVAAGRYGAVTVDVSDPKAPVLAGNCTVQNDLSFYASGVRADGENLFIAGGEWGILPATLTDPAQACPGVVTPLLPDIPDPDGSDQECSADPPWSVVQWTESYQVPQIGWDPIQTLPVDGTLYTFGDARRNSLRAVDLRQIGTPGLDKIGRYEEPRLVEGLTAKNGRVVAVGPGGGVFDRDDAELLKPVLGAVAPPADAVALRLLDDGRWVAATPTSLQIQGAADPITLDAVVWPDGLEVSGADVFVADSTGVRLIDADTAGQKDYLPFNQVAELPMALELAPDGVISAAPEWLSARQRDGGSEPKALAPHGVFNEKDIQSIPLWQRGVPHRMLLTVPSGLVEVATLGGRAGLFVHASNERVELPQGDYRTATSAESKVYLVTADRSAYMSSVITVDVAGPAPIVVAIESFTGVATGVAADGDRLYVADGHRGIRVYDRSGPDLSLLGFVVGSEVAP